ncbi:hypothetical protein LC593_01775 [Nostoc sp. CHAB 5844]|nr:hypothetical protein [Nostoc sp. CHAB 5844]
MNVRTQEFSASRKGKAARWGDTALRGLRALKQVSSALPTAARLPRKGAKSYTKIFQTFLPLWPLRLCGSLKKLIFSITV